MLNLILLPMAAYGVDWSEEEEARSQWTFSWNIYESLNQKVLSWKIEADVVERKVVRVEIDRF